MNRFGAWVRLGVTGLFVAAGFAGLVSCSREMKVLTPKVNGAVTYDNTIRHLFADRSAGSQPVGCTSCHHAGTGIPDWAVYDTVLAYRQSVRDRLDSVPGQVTGNMRQFLKPGEPDIVINWIDAGAPR